MFGCRCRFAKPRTSIATQRPPLLISLFRLVRDGSALCGPVGVWHRGAAGVTGKQTALYAFESLSRCFGVLCADRSIGLRGTDAP